MTTKEITVGDIKIGGANPFVLIAGPCVIESENDTLKTAGVIADIAGRHGIPFIYKASFDKANRTSVDSYRGPGLEKGLAILKRVRTELDIPVLSDIHCRHDIKYAAKVLDVIQIPAFLSRQTDLISEAAKTGKVVNIKKGQFLAPWDMRHVIKKVESRGNRKILITERGVSFGYNNLVSDFRAIPVMREFGYPVVFDATHSVQIPGGQGTASGGMAEFIPTLARCAVVAGADAVFMEVHENPAKALSDGLNALAMKDLQPLLANLLMLKKVMNGEA